VCWRDGGRDEVIRVSDTHAWPSQTVAEVLVELDGHINHLRALTSSFVGEEAQTFKYAMGEATMHAQDVRARIEELLTAPAPRQEAKVAVPQVRPAAPAPVGAHRRQMGEDTRAWYMGGNLVPMRRNRGPQ
jgi:hypothetical protein